MRRILKLVRLVAVALLWSLGRAPVRAQTTQSVTLGAGGKATISFTAFCLDFGVKFPDQIQLPNALVEDKIRAALAYIQSNNLTADETKALDAQYAIWQLRGATNSPAGGAQAKAVVAAATTPPPNPQGTSLLDAAKANQVRLSVASWQPIGNKVPLGAGTDNFYGQGTLTVENISQQRLTLYMPIGTVFPPTTAGSQTIAGFTTQMQVTDPGKQAPQQLPNTGTSEPPTLAMLSAIGLLLFLAGTLMQRRAQH